MSANNKSVVHYARTDDGWKIALHHHPARGRSHSVFLVHGLASNYRNMDFPLKDYSLARFLAKHGFDTWIVDLRGCGLSKKAPVQKRLKWYFDDFVFRDLPSAVQKMQALTGKRRFHWIGHSLGGLLALPFVQTFVKSDILQSLIMVATPVTTQAKPGYFKLTYRLEPLLKLFPFMPYRTISRIATHFVDSLMGMKNQMLFSDDNMSREILKTIMQHAVESVPTSLILQIHDWLRHQYFASKDKKIDFTTSYEKLKAPVLMIAGSADSFTPLADMRLAFRKFPQKKKKLLIFGKSRGHASDYGHIDLLLGKNAPQEVFPHILDWLIEHDQAPQRRRILRKEERE